MEEKVVQDILVASWWWG